MNKKNILIGGGIIALAIIMVILALLAGDPIGSHGHTH